MNLSIRNAHIIDPKNQRDEIADVLIEEGRIKEIGKSLSQAKGEEIDAKGLYLFPGLIDLHSHFREPGFEAKETILTGARAALQGGYIAVVTMPNTNPPCDHQGVVEKILQRAKEVPFKIFPAGAISKGREGKELSEMADLKAAGVVAVTDDGSWVMDSLLMRRAMEYAAMFDLIVMSHCEDHRLSAGGSMHEGYHSTCLGLLGIPAESEIVAVARDIELARMTGARLHLCHLSSARSVDLVRKAKADKISITAEVTPHHLTLTDETAEGYNTNAKMYPPLRTKADVTVLRQALKEGIIDCIATDHAPHTEEEKMQEFDQAPFGVIGLETALAVVMTELYHNEKWPLPKIVEKFTAAPASILKLQPGYGEILKGTEANLALVDVNREWTVSNATLGSKSKNSCFLKKTMKGKVAATICAGKLWKF